MPYKPGHTRAASLAYFTVADPSPVMRWYAGWIPPLHSSSSPVVTIAMLARPSVVWSMSMSVQLAMA